MSYLLNHLYLPKLCIHLSHRFLLLFPVKTPLLFFINVWTFNLDMSLCRNRNRDGMTNQKENGFKKRLEIATTVIFGKLWKTIKIKQVCEKPDCWIRESVTRRKGVSTLQRPPEGGTFNQKCKVDVVFEILIFPKNNETNNTKKKHKYFFDFWARQGLTLVLRILNKDEKSGVRGSLNKRFGKLFEKKNIYIFWR